MSGNKCHGHAHASCPTIISACSRMDGQMDPLENRKWVGKGRVLFFPSSPPLVLYKGDSKPFFRLLCYHSISTLRKIFLSLFSLSFPSLAILRWPLATLLSSTCLSCCKSVNFSSFRLSYLYIFLFSLFFCLK